ncbi:unnamed protein product [Hermetia illucens]|uniref:Uncharacterized protein n=1 Tax=Hermetia illucens TaxID=343691 RepID=A0A7R8YNC5_HERIL|nr:unnamed protein product [Hermetia illucens]
MGGIGAPPVMSAGLNGNSLVDTSCDESSQLINSERAHIQKNNAPRDLKLDNGIIKMPQTQHKPPHPPQDGDNDTTGGGTTTEESSCCDTDSKSVLSGAKKTGGKLNKTGTKNVTLKRVSFGSSKGSMVETLVFETPTPLPEHAEREFGFPAENFSTISAQQQQYSGGGFVGGGGGGGYGGGINVVAAERTLERSKVRVTFFQSSKPQQVSPPESYINYTTDSSLPLLSDSFIIDTSTLSESNMTAATATQPTYDRQISTESGWDNPFRPGGDLSREADEIVNMIKGGKPITPTGDASHSIANGNAQKDTGNHAIENGTAVIDGATKTEVSHVQSTPAQNGTKSPQQNSKTMSATGNKANGDTKTQTAPQTQVSNQVIPGPISASHVVIEDKKKKKCTCCVIQ